MSSLQTILAKIIGFSIIGASCVNKLPVIRNILASGTVQGLSLSSVYAEIVVYLNGAFYGYKEGHPVSNYGENIAVALQSLIIVGLIMTHTQISLPHRILAALTFFVYTTSCLYLLPNDYNYLLMAANMPVYLYSRGQQIWVTYCLKHTGAQSIATTTMSLVGSLIRIGTTMAEVGLDLAFLSSFFAGLLLNGILFVQYFVYKENTGKFLREVEAKKEK